MVVLKIFGEILPVVRFILCFRWYNEKIKDLFCVRYYNSAIEEHGPESRRIAEIAAANDVIIVTGVVERQGGTLYCSVSGRSYGRSSMV